MTAFGKRLDGPGGRRSAPRAAVLLSAAMHAVGSSQPATLLDVSKTGARLRTRAPLHEGLHVWIKVPPADVFGTVMWIDGELCGVEFDEPFTDEEAAQLQSRGRVMLMPSLSPEEQLAVEDWKSGFAR